MEIITGHGLLSPDKLEPYVGRKLVHITGENGMVCYKNLGEIRTENGKIRLVSKRYDEKSGRDYYDITNLSELQVKDGEKLAIV